MINHGIVKITIATLTCVLVTFVVLASLAMAQEPSPFKISLIPQDNQAASGSQFVYTVVVTNVSSIAVKQAIVSVVMPEGVTFVDAQGGKLGWLVKKPAQSAPNGRVIWFNPDGTVAPSEVVTFQMTVDVAAASAGKKLVTEAFTLVGEGNVDKTVPGTTVEVAVFTPTPLPTPTLLVPPSPTPTLSPTKEVVATPTVAQAKPEGILTCFSGIVIMGLVLASAMVVSRNQ